MEEITKDIIGRCREGDMDAFAGLVQCYERPVYGFVYRLLHNSRHSESAEDIVQDVFLKVYQKIETYDPDRGSKFSTWLFTVARNHCISILRRKRVEDRAAGLGDDDFDRVPDHDGNNPRDVAGNNEICAKVARAVAMLPETIRSAFILKHYEEMTYDEIAVVLDTSPGTVKSRVNRAKQKLLEELEDDL